ncbi:MAG: glutaredoxin 3 [Dokdonella sp.]|uniref:glutaredoxin 3 n=1 Tax=Dokdonella sp. TaxID=2291710 RepID=UPI0025BC3333|nr:glutaredoxin 3 [Dokdonella sp.]MBX3701675.1 glutaredoxin 3 [Dokdonella sp.]MCW5578969.1 glutaredoxin 3 [Dokdonella sp.]
MPRIEVFTSASCPYCIAAKQHLARKGFSYEEIRIDLDPTRRSEMLERAAGRRTVPQIFIDGTHVGGYDDMVAADRDGRLDALLGTRA